MQPSQYGAREVRDRLEGAELLQAEEERGEGGAEGEGGEDEEGNDGGSSSGEEVDEDEDMGEWHCWQASGLL